MIHFQGFRAVNFRCRRNISLFVYASMLASVMTVVILIKQSRPETKSAIDPDIDKKAPSPVRRKIFPYGPIREMRTNCAAVFDGEREEIRRALMVSNKLRQREPEIPDGSFTEMADNCKTFKKDRNYITSSLTKEEANFPIAYSILVFKDSEMVERLIRAIYRPQNYYCIHVDSTSSNVFYSDILSLSECFPNVIMAPSRINITWATFSVLAADLLCMKTLWRFSKWRYFINLTGQEFPLRTNWEIVRILKAFNGANDIHASSKESIEERRFEGNLPPPGVQALKGSVHITASRPFVDFVLHDARAAPILSWVRGLRKFHDEAFFATINHNPSIGAPGSYTGYPEFDPLIKPFLSRYKIWMLQEGQYCYSQRFVRDICILTTGDLFRMSKSSALFANKFYLQEDRIAIGCLEEKLYNKTRGGYIGTYKIDTSYYSNLDFVKRQIRH